MNVLLSQNLQSDFNEKLQFLKCTISTILSKVNSKWSQFQSAAYLLYLVQWKQLIVIIWLLLSFGFCFHLAIGVI
jgi:hypothetical protein